MLSFMEEQGGAWGMRKEVEEKAATAIHESMVSLAGLHVTSPITVRVRFDELKLEIDLCFFH